MQQEKTEDNDVDEPSASPSNDVADSSYSPSSSENERQPENVENLSYPTYKLTDIGQAPSQEFSQQPLQPKHSRHSEQNLDAGKLPQPSMSTMDPETQKSIQAVKSDISGSGYPTDYTSERVDLRTDEIGHRRQSQAERDKWLPGEEYRSQRLPPPSHLYQQQSVASYPLQGQPPPQRFQQAGPSHDRYYQGFAEPLHPDIPPRSQRPLSDDRDTRRVREDDVRVAEDPRYEPQLSQFGYRGRPELEGDREITGPSWQYAGRERGYPSQSSSRPPVSDWYNYPEAYEKHQGSMIPQASQLPSRSPSREMPAKVSQQTEDPSSSSSRGQSHLHSRNQATANVPIVSGSHDYIEVTKQFPSFIGQIDIAPNGPGQQPPMRSERIRTSTMSWEDEGTLCIVVEINGTAIARRCDNNMINGTKLLNVANMTRGRRDGILKGERIRHVVKIGQMFLKGVWIPFERALEIARREDLVDMLFPLFKANIASVLYDPPNLSRTRQVVLAAYHKTKDERFRDWVHGIPRQFPSASQVRGVAYPQSARAGPDSSRPPEAPLGPPSRRRQAPSHPNPFQGKVTSNYRPRYEPYQRPPVSGNLRHSRGRSQSHIPPYPDMSAAAGLPPESQYSSSVYPLPRHLIENTSGSLSQSQSELKQQQPLAEDEMAEEDSVSSSGTSLSSSNKSWS